MATSISAKRRAARLRRHERVRLHVAGTGERPRLSVYRSLRHMRAQIVDDIRGHTLVAVSTLDPDVSARFIGAKRVDQARVAGQVLAERAKAAGVSSVVFDRGGYIYHGRVRALAEGARAAGLDF